MTKPSDVGLNPLLDLHTLTDTPYNKRSRSWLSNLVEHSFPYANHKNTKTKQLKIRDFKES